MKSKLLFLFCLLAFVSEGWAQGVDVVVDKTKGEGMIDNRDAFCISRITYDEHSLYFYSDSPVTCVQVSVKDETGFVVLREVFSLSPGQEYRVTLPESLSEPLELPFEAP